MTKLKLARSLLSTTSHVTLLRPAIGYCHNHRHIGPANMAGDEAGGRLLSPTTQLARICGQIHCRQGRELLANMDAGLETPPRT